MVRKGLSLRLVVSTLIFAIAIVCAFWSGRRYNDAKLRNQDLEAKLDVAEAQLARQEAQAAEKTGQLQEEVDGLNKAAAALAGSEQQLRQSLARSQQQLEQSLARSEQLKQSLARSQQPVSPAPEPAPVVKPQPVYGLVTAILYSETNSSAVVDGQILRAGSTMRGVKVVSISRNEVEFSTDSTTWKQGIDQTPNPAWGRDK